MTQSTEERVREQLKSVTYPGMSRNIVSFGFVQDVMVNQDKALIQFKPSTTDPDLIRSMEKDIVETVSHLEGINSVEVQTVEADFQVDISASVTESPDAAQQQGPHSLPGVKHVIAVASGKGGVGKSTVAVNLTEALSRQGYKTGLADLDIYGPSAPTMLGIRGRPSMNDEDQIVPLRSRGIDVMSIGFILGQQEPTIWRGPMVMKAVEEFLHKVDWGEQDVLIADLPPGTGDAQLSLMQTVALDGVVVVTTPQILALLDVDRSVEMCREMEIPILGIVENMASFRCDDCGKDHAIFGSGGGEEMATRLNVPFLGKIPIDPVLREGGDRGRPLVDEAPDHPISQQFMNMAKQLDDEWEETE